MIKLYLSCVAFLFLTCACQSKKSLILEQKKQAKDSLDILHALIDSNMIIRAEKMSAIFREVHPEWNESVLKNEIMYDTISYYVSDKMQALIKYHNAIRDRHDSLEFEFRKLGL